MRISPAYSEDCYLNINADRNKFDATVLDQQIRPLLIKYISVDFKKVGIAGENYFEVVSGIAVGTRVVSGSFQAIRELEDGSRIEIDEPAESELRTTVNGSGGGDDQ